MSQFTKHLIRSGSSIKEALVQLNALAKDAILFVIDDAGKLMGAMTDGDVRRGLIKGHTIDCPVDKIIQSNPRYIRKGESDIKKIIEFREQNFRIIPVLNKHDDTVVNVINFREMHSYLPIDAVIMAGGKGQRLMPLTASTPKPLLPVGDRPIIDHNLTRLAHFGIDDFWISVNYLGDQIKSYFGDGADRNVHICYVGEDRPLGTIGAVSQINNFRHEHVLITNSDVLTNLDYEHFFLEYLQQDADMAVVTIPYQVSIPYAVLETNDGMISAFKEKPQYTYYSNGGIYLVKRSILLQLPQNTFYNATDLMETLIQQSKRIFSYPLMGYWIDIGSPEEYKRAQEDIYKIKF